jgi:hypothetical protein
MTQDYEPIEITESTPEPKENGIYLLTITQCGERYCVPVWRDGIWRDIEGDHMWSELVDSIKNTGNPTIQSLTAHDAQIRAEALDFADAEQIDNGKELLNEALSEAVKEYLLYGAHPLSTEDNSDDIWDDAELFNLKLTNGDVIDCSELADEVLDALKRYLKGQPMLQSIPVKGQKQ